MFNKLPEEIFSMVKRLDQSEVKSFKTFAQRKKPSDSKGHKYIQLFDLYLKQKKELEFSESTIKKESRTLTDSLPDLNQKLHEELLKFLMQNFREKGTDAIERKVEDLLDTSFALYEKKLFKLSAEQFLEAITILKNVTDLNLTERILYLALKAYSWIITIKYAGKLSEEEQAFFDIIHADYMGFSQIARQAYSALKNSEQDTKMANVNFNKAAFYALLNMYFRERREFDEILNGKGNMSLFPIETILNLKKYGGNDPKISQAENSIIDASTFFFQLERLYAALIVNEPFEFDSTLSNIQQKLFGHFTLPVFNADLVLFISRQLFELKTLFTLQSNQPPNDLFGLKNLDKITKDNMHLFYESEIDDMALRIEMNTFVIRFLENNFKTLLPNLLKFEKEIKKERLKDYFIDIKLMIILCKMEVERADEDLDDRIESYENYTKRLNASKFHEKFDGFLIQYRNAAFNDRKKVCSKYLKTLEASRETFNHFHAVFLRWLKKQSS